MAVSLFSLLLVACAGATRQSDEAGAGPATAATPPGSPQAASRAPASTPSPTVSPSATPFGAAHFDDPDDCTDDTVGYRVAHPDSWWWNLYFDSEIGPHLQCRYFAPNEFDATAVSFEQPTPAGVTITASLIPPGDAHMGIPGEARSSEETTIAGRRANVVEFQYTAGGFLQPGELVYRYGIDLGDGRELYFNTDNTVGDYDENRAVLDGMMASLQLFDPGEICGAEGPRFVCGEIVVRLREGSNATIEEIVDRVEHGDSPTQISQRMDDTRTYVLSVTHGFEDDSVRWYRHDEAVEDAHFNWAEGEPASSPSGSP